jgi:hypothetical protein
VRRGAASRRARDARRGDCAQARRAGGRMSTQRPMTREDTAGAVAAPAAQRPRGVSGYQPSGRRTGTGRHKAQSGLCLWHGITSLAINSQQCNRADHGRLCSRGECRWHATPNASPSGQMYTFIAIAACCFLHKLVSSLLIHQNKCFNPTLS